MAEWFKAAVLKTASLKGDVGSNPTPSAKYHISSLVMSSEFRDWKNYLKEIAPNSELKPRN